MNAWLQLRPEFRKHRRVFWLYKLRRHVDRWRSTAGLQVLSSRQVLRLQLAAALWFYMEVSQLWILDRTEATGFDRVVQAIAMGFLWSKFLRWALRKT